MKNKKLLIGGAIGVLILLLLLKKRKPSTIQEERLGGGGAGAGSGSEDSVFGGGGYSGGGYSGGGVVPMVQPIIAVTPSPIPTYRPLPPNRLNTLPNPNYSLRPKPITSPNPTQTLKPLAITSPNVNVASTQAPSDSMVQSSKFLTFNGVAGDKHASISGLDFDGGFVN